MPRLLCSPCAQAGGGDAVLIGNKLVPCLPIHSANVAYFEASVQSTEAGSALKPAVGLALADHHLDMAPGSSEASFGFQSSGNVAKAVALVERLYGQEFCSFSSALSVYLFSAGVGCCPLLTIPLSAPLRYMMASNSFLSCVVLPLRDARRRHSAAERRRRRLRLGHGAQTGARIPPFA